MSDDEEIMLKGNVLHSYLADQGFSDVETYLPVDKRIEHVGFIEDQNSNESIKDELYKEMYSTPIEISSNEQYRLSSILNSMLMFKEDVDIINAVTLNMYIPSKRFNLWNCISIGMASMLTSAILYKQRSKLNTYISFGIMLPFLTYSGWQCLQKYIEIHENKLLISHLSVLKRLCCSSHKIIRYLKETEILSSGQVTMQNVGSAIYAPVHEKNDLNTLPLWKTLPQLRRYLVDALIETLNILSIANDSGRQILPLWFSDCGHLSLNETLKFTDTLMKTNKCITLKDILVLNDIYLIAQSEYLKWVALCVSPSVWRNSSILKSTAKRKAFKILSKVQSELTQVSCTLIMQYNIHNAMFITSKIKPNKSLKCLKEIDLIQIDVHNVFLHILYLLLRVRCFEDYLENLSDGEEQQKTFIETVTKELTTLKDDFVSAERCFENIIHDILFKKNSKEDLENNLKSHDHNVGNTEPKPKETGIVVGVSDFNINSADEVFLAVSGMNSNECETYLDDWCIEKKPQIPKNLLLELSRTLQSRKEEFIERERVALEKQGIHDIEFEKNNRSLGEKGEKKDCQVHMKKKRNRILSPDSTSSESSAEYIQERTVGLPKRRVRTSDKKYKGLSNKSSDSEKSTDDDDEHTITKFKPITDVTVDSSGRPINSSIANIIAMKSQMWGKTTEELFSDG